MGKGCGRLLLLLLPFLVVVKYLESVMVASSELGSGNRGRAEGLRVDRTLAGVLMQSSRKEKPGQGNGISWEEMKPIMVH